MVPTEIHLGGLGGTLPGMKVPLEQVAVGDLLDLMLVPVLGRIALGDTVLLAGGEPRASPGPKFGVARLLWSLLTGLDQRENSLNC